MLVAETHDIPPGVPYPVTTKPETRDDSLHLRINRLFTSRTSRIGRIVVIAQLSCIIIWLTANKLESSETLEQYICIRVCQKAFVYLSTFPKAPVASFLLHTTTLIFSVGNWKKNWHSNMYLPKSMWVRVRISNSWILEWLIFRIWKLRGNTSVNFSDNRFFLLKI